MKKFFILLAFTLTMLPAFAQRDVTKFLGIPVDGFKPDMIRKLEAKGFSYNKADDCLYGEFNGYDVRLSVVTNNNKVYRIVVADEHYTSEQTIISRFNKLCDQFANNDRYSPFALDYRDFKIKTDEHLSYEIIVNKKRYEASFFQITESIDSVALEAEYKAKLKKHFSDEQLENPTEDMKKEFVSMCSEMLFEYMTKKSVWFYIDERYTKYGIVMYYDNEYNRANGEDL